MRVKHMHECFLSYNFLALQSQLPHLIHLDRGKVCKPELAGPQWTQLLVLLTQCYRCAMILLALHLAIHFITETHEVGW